VLAADAPEEGLQIAVELIRQLRKIEGLKGVHIRPIGGAEDSVNKLVQYAGLMPDLKAAATA